MLAFAQEQITPYLTSECDTLSLVEGVVNANNGKLVQVENDIHIDGSDPLEMTRYYDGGHHFIGLLGYSMGNSFPLSLHFYPEKEEQNLLVEQRKGSYLFFTLKKDGKKNFKGKIDPNFYTHGYTNCCEALLRGEPPIYAMWAEGDKNKFIVHLGNGTRRHYQHYITKDQTRKYRLVLEERPNGTCRHFSYISKNFIDLKRIWTTNKDNSLTLNFLDFDNSEYVVSITGSNGQKVDYHMDYKKVKHKKKKFTVEGKVRFMSDVVSNHLLGTHYEALVRQNFFNTYFSIDKVIGPEGRSLFVEYDKNERVKSLSSSETDIPMYSFVYKFNCTEVTDARGAKKEYSYNKERLKSITEFHRHLYYDWDKLGQLESHRITDPEGKTITERKYQYDAHGNISQTDVFGNITQKDSKDTYYVRYTHTTDGNNLPITENHNDQHVITYGYFPNTQILASKHTFADQKFVEKEFYQYDKNGILIQKIVDDGNSVDINDLSNTSTRLVTDIEPQLNPGLSGMTLPKIIRQSYVDPKTGEKHLLSKTERIYSHGDLLAEEKVYDAQENYRYSTYYEYNTQRKLIKTINAIGETTLYNYDANHNKIYEEKLGSGKKTHFIYDTSNRLIEEIEEHADGNILKTSSTYDIMGNKIATVDEFKQVTTYEYDLSSREIAKIDPLRYVEYKKYDAQNHIIEKIDNDGFVTKTIYNMYGSPLEVLYPDGSSKTFIYNLQGHLIKEWEKDGTYTTYELDYLGRTKIENKYSKEGRLLKSLQNVYSGKNLISKIDALGHQTNYSYDGAGRLVSMENGGVITFYEYDSLGRQSKIAISDHVTLFQYDNLDRIVQRTIQDAQGNLYSKEEYSYDTHGNKTIERIYSNNDSFAEHKTLYNSQNLPTKSIDPLGNETSIFYDFTDHLEKTTVDALGRSEIEVYDPLNRVKEVRVKSPFGTVIAESSFSYDGRGNKIHQQEKVLSDDISLGYYHVYTSYDSMGQKILEDEQGEKITRFSYNCGRLESITNPDGVVISHTYDPLGRLEVQSSSDGTIYHRFSYDLNDNVIQAEDVVQETTTYRSYDIKDRLIYEKQASGFEINYSYDPLDRVSEVIFENNRMAYFYTPTCPSSISRYKDNQMQYTYSQHCDLQGRPLSKSITNNSPINYVWDKLGRCIEIDSSAYSQRLCYDKVGNLVSTKISDPLGEYETLFAYDDLNQLIGETGAFDNQYTNDSVNNRRSKNALACNVNELNQLLDDTIDNFSYDANGRRDAKEWITIYL